MRVYIFFAIWGFLSTLLAITQFVAHAGTATDTHRPLRIAIVDTGLDPELGLQTCAGESRDFSGAHNLADNWPKKHGSNVAALIAEYAGKANYCLIIVKYIDTPGSHHDGYMEALGYATSIHADFINLSLEGRSYSGLEKSYLKNALRIGATVIVAAGNNRQNLSTKCDVYPACLGLNGLVVVGSNTGIYSNKGGPINALENGSFQSGGGSVLSGTSQATAIHTGKLVHDTIGAADEYTF